MQDQYKGINEDINLIFEQNKSLWHKIKNKKILITGGTGPFGFWILKSFIFANETLKLKSKMYVLTRKISKENKIFSFCKNENITFIKGDVRNFKFNNGKLDYIIHGATTTALETFRKQDPDEKSP